MESEQTLLSAISQIKALDAGAMDAARKRQAELAKPPGSLGLLEDISVQLAGITGSVKIPSKKRASTFLPPTTAWSTRASAPRRSR